MRSLLIPGIAAAGRPTLDDDCRALAKDLSELFDVRPMFSFYRDAPGPGVNSVALRYSLLPDQGTDGTVLIGVNLIAPYIRYYIQGGSFPVEVFVVMAHEFAHILQFKVNAVDSWHMEPHADFLAGWAAKRSRRIGQFGKINERPEPPKEAPELQKEWAREIGDIGDLVPAAWALFQLGDTAFTDSEHHGEPELRDAMVRAGFEYGDRSGVNAKSAFNEGMLWAHLERKGGLLE